MSKINFPKKQEQRLIPKYLLEYAEELQENHPDPSAEWGGGDDIAAGTGITITTESDDTKTISIDETVVATKSDIIEVTANTGLTPSATLTDIQVGDTVYEIPQGGGTSYTAGTGIDITGSTISVVDSEVVTAANITTALGYPPSSFSGEYDDLTNKPDLSIYAESADLATVATTGDYDDLLDKPDLSVYAETADLGDCAYLDENELSIDYSQLTNTPTIPVVPTDVSAFNNDAGYITSADLPTNHVTTDTAQTITAAKTFQGTNLINFKGDITTDTLGFTAYDSSNNELGNLQIKQRSLQTRQDAAATNRTLVTLGDYATDKNSLVGFRVRTTSGTNWQMNFVAPHMTYNQLNNAYGTNYNTYYIPTFVTDGTNKVFADNTGKVDISSLIPTVPTNYVTTDTNQTVGGIKTFTDSVDLQDTARCGQHFQVYGGSSNYKIDITSMYSSLYPNLRYNRLDAYMNNSTPTFDVRLSNANGTQGEYTFVSGKTGTVAITDDIPTSTSDLTNDSGFITGINSSDVTTALGFTPYSSANPDGYITGITSGDVTTALGYTPGTSNFSGSYTDLTDKPSIPTTATSTSTLTPTTSSFMTSTTKTTETLTFTYADNTTANITIVTGVTDNTSSAMTGATVTTTTTLS